MKLESEMNKMSENAAYSFLYDLPRVDFNKEGLKYVPRIQYGREHPRQFMDCVYKDDKTIKPVVIWIHGGGWNDDNLTQTYRPEKALAQLAKEGFFIVCIEYRLAQHGIFPACIHDCQLAVKYLRQHNEELMIDSERMGVWGESAGAHLASLVGVNYNDDNECNVQAVVSWYSPMDLVSQAINEDAGEDDNCIAKLIGGRVSDNMDIARIASPLNYAEKNLPPFLLMHGNVDQLVPYEQSVGFYDKAKDAGNVIEMITVPGQGHGFFLGQEYYDKIRYFLVNYLK